METGNRVTNLRSPLVRRIESLPSVFARIAFLAGCSNRAAPHWWLQDLHGPSLPGSINELWRRTFRQWLALSFRSQVDDCRPFVQTLALAASRNSERHFVHWAGRLIPSEASRTERKHFLIAVEVALGTVFAERKVGYRTR